MNIQIIDPLEYRNIKINKIVSCLWLDDEREIEHYFTKDNINKIIFEKARNYDEFIELIKSEGYKDYDMICFDHDLGYGRNGYDCAKALANEIEKFGLDNNINIFIHSSNYSGCKNIYSILKNTIKQCHL